jgi:PAS domain S-box-containing protein
MIDPSVERTEQATQRLRFLVKASDVLSSSLDYLQTLKTVAQLAVPELADWCSIDMRTPDGSVERLAVMHIDPEKVKWAHELHHRFPYDPNAPTGVAFVLRTGESEFFPHITEEMIHASTSDPELLDIINEIGFTSVMTVPLKYSEKTFGALSLVTAESGRIYDEDDLALAQELGRRAGLAVENARLYSEVRQTNELLKRQSDRLDALISAVPGVVWEAWGEPDVASQRIDFVSDHIVSMLGYSVEEWLSTSNFWLTIVHPEDKERAAREAADIFVGQRPGISEFRWLAKDGRTLWVEARSVVISDGEGNPIGMRGMTFDITERKETEERLALAKEEAELANRAKDQFLAMLSHELRTPLTPVLTVAQVLEADPNLPEDMRPLVEIVRRNIELEARLIDDLLDLNRIIRGKLPLDLGYVDAHGLIRNVVEICQSDLNNANVRFVIDLQASRSIIHADTARIQQVFWNLLKNAIKFTPSNGSIAIRTRNAEADGGLIIDFQDTGIGIDREILPKIFHAFEQGESAITRNFGGLGLGLAISKAITDTHGAVLTADSLGKGQGATFTLAIPTVTNDTPELRKINGSSSLSELSHPWRILFVDDHEDTGRVNQVLLERRGYRVALAQNFAEAAALAHAKEFDLLISDIGLPDRSGHDVMRELRAINPTIRGIALSGFGMEEDIRRSLAAGFDEHLTKPVTFSKLLSVIEHLMAR